MFPFRDKQCDIFYHSAHVHILSFLVTKMSTCQRIKCSHTKNIHVHMLCIKMIHLAIWWKSFLLLTYLLSLYTCSYFITFITHLCLALGVEKQEGDLERFSDKRVSLMSYKNKGSSNDTFRLFGENEDSSNVSSTSHLPDWAIQIQEGLVESKKMINELKAKVVQQDAKIKGLEASISSSKASTSKHYVRSTNRAKFFDGTSG